jgi:4-hydroxybenzoate polyprenyltransferase
MYGELVMFSNSLFSLSFGIVAMLLAAHGFPELWKTFWIIVALVAGRTGANALNRVADRDIDAKDPRTAGRHIPAGKLRTREVCYFIGVCALLLFIAAAALGKICVYLLPVAAILFVVYSYSKRFTWLCHVILGFACAVAPAGAWIAVTGGLNFVGCVVCLADVLWVAGFDIIYAIQDRDFDLKEGLYSIPVRFGEETALFIAALFHIGTFLLLCSLVFFTELSWIYAIGVLVIGGFLFYEHRLVSPRHYGKVIFASYQVNQIISIILLFCVILDLFL